MSVSTIRKRVSASAPRGRLYTDTTQAGTPASTVETLLKSWVVPPFTLEENGQVLSIEAFGRFAVNANMKTVRVTLGGVQLVSFANTASTDSWRYAMQIIRQGAANQLSITSGNFAASVVRPLPVALTLTLAAALTLEVLGLNGVAAANDILYQGLIVGVE